MSDDLETGAAVLTSDIISEDDELSRQHKTIVDTYQKITNPISAMTVWDYQRVLKEFSSVEEVISSPRAITRFKEALRKTEAYKKEFERRRDFRKPEEHIGLALFPYSQSKETDLFTKLGLVPLQVSLMDALTEGIRSGAISLRTDEDSGWYSYQQFALETLLLPEKAVEADKLVLSEEYKEHLKEAFKGMLTKARETHVRQLEAYKMAKEPEPEVKIDVWPELCVEPMATNYLRVAQGYKFPRKAIKAVLGKGALNNLHRMKEDGSKSEKTLSEELDDMIELMYGIYLKACNDLGMEPDLEKLSKTELRAAEQRATQWLTKLEEDDDLKTDTRVIVPVGNLVCWATLGVQLMKIHVEYDERPTVTILVEGKEVAPEEADVDIHFSEIDYWIPVDVFSEVVLGPDPLTREEFRQICDQYISKEEIIKELKARKGKGFTLRRLARKLKG